MKTLEELSEEIRQITNIIHENNKKLKLMMKESGEE
jgi:hypothetical protein